MTLSIYLNFDGTCAEAFAFYADVFGTDPVIVMKFSDGPSEFQPDADEMDKIMHMSLPIGDSVLMGSDVAKGWGEPPTPANCFSISYAARTRQDAEEKFTALSDGGSVKMPMGEMFWGSYFGMVTDRYGTSWMIAYDTPAGAD